MLDITNALLRLKESLAIQDGEILSITLNKAGKDAINAECLKFCSHLPIGTCPTCGRVNVNPEILGIQIK